MNCRKCGKKLPSQKSNDICSDCDGFELLDELRKKYEQEAETSGRYLEQLKLRLMPASMTNDSQTSPVDGPSYNRRWWSGAIVYVVILVSWAGVCLWTCHTAAQWSTFGSAFLPLLLPLVGIGLLIAVACTANRLAEWLVWGVLLLLFICYYSPSLEQCLLESHRLAVSNSGVSTSLITLFASSCGAISTFIFSRLPGSWPKLLSQSLSPCWIVATCLSIRWGIYRFVTDRPLRRHASAYWLFIAAYFSFVIILSHVSGWNLTALLLGSAIVALLLFAGFARVLEDGCKFALRALGAVWELFNIAWRWVVWTAALFAKLLRAILKNIRKFYERWIVQPICLLFALIDGKLAEWKRHIVDKTDNLKDED